MWGKKIYNRNGYGATPIVFVLIPLALLGGFLLFSYTRDTHEPEIKAIAIKERSSQDNLSVDSDQDGLKDWEEQIYGTDPHNADTDGDGTKDGDEIAQNRDPLKKGPDDALTKQDTSLTLSPPSPEYIGDQPNLTRKIAEVFGTDYITGLIQDNQNQPDINATVDKMTRITLDQQSSHVPLITASDILVSHNATRNDMAYYINQFNAILSNPLKPLPNIKGISDVLTNIVHTDDTTLSSTAVDKLATYVSAYSQFLTDIKTISVPENFLSLHLDYLNTATEEREALKKINMIKTDPFMAILGLREFTDTTTKFADLQQKYIKLENTLGIIAERK